MQYLIEAKNIHKSYENTKVLNGVDVSLKKNSSLAIMGASGEGKTTLLHILGSLEDFDAGSLNILNFTTNSLLCEKIGFIFQNYNLLDDFTLLENILSPPSIARKNISSNSEMHNRAIDLLQMVGLDSRKDILAQKLSGGEKQRAAIARALIMDPDIILADEPTGNLDYKNSIIVHELLISSVKKHKKSLIVATHDKSLASMCDEIYTLKDGIIENSHL